MNCDNILKKAFIEAKREEFADIAVNDAECVLDKDFKERVFACFGKKRKKRFSFLDTTAKRIIVACAVFAVAVTLTISVTAIKEPLWNSLKAIFITSETTSETDIQATDTVYKAESEASSDTEPADTETGSADKSSGNDEYSAADNHKESDEQVYVNIPTDVVSPDSGEAALPSSSAEKEKILTGKLNDKISWVFNRDTMVLTVSGSGPMPNYTEATRDTIWPPVVELAEKLIISDDITTIGDYAFSNFVNLRSDPVLPSRLTRIGDGAFKDCHVFGKLEVPDTVTYIGHYAFYCVTPHPLILPSNLPYVADDAFSRGDSLIQVLCFTKIKEGKPIEPGKLPSYFETDVTIPLGSNVTGYFDYGRKMLVIIGSGAIDDNPPWPENVKKAISVTFDDRITEFGNNCFRDFLYIERISDIPQHVTRIGDGAFSGIQLYTKMTIPEGCTYIGDEAFSGSYAQEINLPSTLKHIGKQAFRSCAVKNLVIPDGVETIDDSAFRSCYNLSTVYISDSVKYIGNYVFENCNELLSVRLPTEVEYFGKGVLASCPKITKITIPEGASCLYDEIDCNGALSTLIIPSSVTKFSGKSFRFIPNLKTIYFKGTKEEWDAIDRSGLVVKYTLEKINVVYDYKE